MYKFYAVMIKTGEAILLAEHEDSKFFTTVIDAIPLGLNIERYVILDNEGNIIKERISNEKVKKLQL